MRLALFLLAIAVAPLAPAASPSTADARNFLQNLSEDALVHLGDDGADITEVRRRFKKMYEDSFDTKSMPYLVLGRYWRKADKEQQREFTAAFEEFITVKYADKFRKFNLRSFAIASVHKVRDDIFVISSTINDKKNQAVEVDWRVRFKGGYKIYDISLAGISLVTTQREDFTSVIRRAGDDINALIDRLKTAVADETL